MNDFLDNIHGWLREPLKPECLLHNRKVMRLGPRSRSIAAAAMLQALPCMAVTCDELRADVETRIRGAGVTQFSVSVIEASASSPGKVVGTCERGARKLLYTQAAPSGEAEPALNRDGKKAPPILTECKDGSVSLGGDCKK